jgi:hypothetical protein
VKVIFADFFADLISLESTVLATVSHLRLGVLVVLVVLGVLGVIGVLSLGAVTKNSSLVLSCSTAESFVDGLNSVIRIES